MIKLFQFSCPVFWGFNRHIDIASKTSLEECISEFCDIHEQFLFENNYIDLLKFFKSKRNDYHVHDIKFEDLHKSDNIVYVCRHSNDNDNKKGFLN
jgi:hypothetical protein